MACSLLMEPAPPLPCAGIMAQSDPTRAASAELAAGAGEGVTAGPVLTGPAPPVGVADVVVVVPQAAAATARLAASAASAARRTCVGCGICGRMEKALTPKSQPHSHHRATVAQSSACLAAGPAYSAYLLGPRISTTGGLVGCNDPLAGSTVRATMSPADNLAISTGPAMPWCRIGSMPAGR